MSSARARTDLSLLPVLISSNKQAPLNDYFIQGKNNKYFHAYCIVKIVLFLIFQFSVGYAFASLAASPNVDALSSKTNVAQAETLQKRLRLALVTMAPGKIYWERFGHNAILIEDTVSGESQLYNFGIFDFEQKGFLQNFVQGRMQYRLAAFNPEQDLANYAYEGRGVWIDVLDIPQEKIFQLKLALEENAKPQNAEYRYDYFLENCSTKVRDALNFAFDDALRSATQARSRGATFRSYALQLAAPTSWLAFAIDLGLGPSADQPISAWQEGFIPAELRTQVGKIKSANQTLLVSQTQQILPHQLPTESTVIVDFFLRSSFGSVVFFAIGSFFAFSFIQACAHIRNTTASLNRPAWWARIFIRVSALLQAAVGSIACVLLFLWLATDHQIAYANENLFVFCPLALFFVLPIWSLNSAQYRPSKLLRILANCLLGLATLGLFVKCFPNFNQDNLRWLLLLLPWHYALARVMVRH